MPDSLGWIDIPIDSRTIQFNDIRIFTFNKRFNTINGLDYPSVH